MSRSLSWSPTVAMSWLWGLGFFYAFHVTQAYGLPGFAAFAIPNVAGLALFGQVLGRHRDPAALFASVSGRYAGWMAAYQVAAVAITLFGFGAYLVAPIAGREAAVPAMAALALCACTVGHLAGSAGGLRRIHAGCMAVGVAFASVAVWALWHAAGPAPMKGIEAVDARLVGLALPSLAGFLLGPWLDVQQWQRAVEIRRSGGDPGVAYAGGAALFLGLLCLNAALAIACGQPPGHVGADGLTDMEGAPAVAAAASPLAAAALAGWACIAMATTLDSFQAATRWFLDGTARRATSPLMALVPHGLASSPLPLLGVAFALACWAVGRDLSHMHLMAPFATVLLGAGGCIAMEALGRRPHLDTTLCLMTGALSAFCFAAGYMAASPALLWISAAIALSPVAVALRAGVVRAGVVRAGAGKADGSDAAEAVPAAANSPALPAATPAQVHGGPGYWFEDGWFVTGVRPTYDDTNSVGNVYFANYVRWVGKVRELFFAHCMPDFDLKDTAYYVLTKSIKHDFRAETAEFDSVRLRIRIARHNRKFVTLEHEIVSDTVGLLGRGEQDLMFVDARTHRLIDMPGDIIKGFLPHFDKRPRMAA